MDTKIDSLLAEELLEGRVEGLLGVVGDGRVHEIIIIIMNMDQMLMASISSSINSIRQMQPRLVEAFFPLQLPFLNDPHFSKIEPVNFYELRLHRRVLWGVVHFN